MKRTVRRSIMIAFALCGAAALVYAFTPRPIEVETVTATRMPMKVTVNEDGQTRIKERYIVSAPLTGRLARSTLDPGSPVVAGKTIIASIEPLDPSLLDPRSQAQASARVKAARAALSQAETALLTTAAASELASSNLTRQQTAFRTKAISADQLDEATAAAAIRAAEHRASGFARDIAQFELEQAEAALLRASPDHNPAEWRFDIPSPVSGAVLRVLQESSAVVTPGTPLMEVGDPADLEAVLDVLTTQAVAIRPGNPVIFERWGGDQPLSGIVRLVEPSAFTKVSALGVEEQRVFVIADFTDPLQARASLGDAFRVEAQVVVWSQDDVLTIPTSSLFRTADNWSVYVVTNGRARVRTVTLGRRNSLQAQVLSGLNQGDVAIAYPSDKVRDGTRVRTTGSERLGNQPAASNQH